VGVHKEESHFIVIIDFVVAICKRYVVASYGVPTAYRLIDSGSFHWYTTFFSTLNEEI
jgi:hypothetical protein